MARVAIFSKSTSHPMSTAIMNDGNVDIHARNHFDLLRIIAAFLVLISHQQPLTGRTEWVIPGYQSLGGIGLLIFFVMSGYLVCESWQRDPNVVRFAIRRLLRIWPGLAVAVILTACVLGPVMSTFPAHAYFADPLFVHYFGILRFNDAGHLPGVFTANPNRVVNGSLWTLPIEVRWYEYLAAAGVLGVLRWRYLLLAITLGMAVHYFVVYDIEHVILAGGKRNWKEELGLYFLAGASLQRFKAAWMHRRLATASITAVAAIGLSLAGQHHVAYWLLVSIGTLSIASAEGGRLASVGRYGDFSYGVYIYAFPVQQTIVALTGNAWPFVVQLFLSALVTLLIAVASWHLVERPALKLKPSRRSRIGSLDAIVAALSWKRRGIE